MQVNEEEVENAIKNLPEKKAPNINKICALMIKKAFPVIKRLIL